MANVVNNASWDLSDVLISSPMTLSHVLKMKQQYAPYEINPSIVVFDEIDLMLEIDEVEKKVLDILKKFATKRGAFAQENAKRQFIFSASTLSADLQSLIQEWFPNIEIIKSDGAHKLQQNIEVKNIYLD